MCRSRSSTMLPRIIPMPRPTSLPRGLNVVHATRGEARRRRTRYSLSFTTPIRRWISCAPAPSAASFKFVRAGQFELPFMPGPGDLRGRIFRGARQPETKLSAVRAAVRADR